MRKACKPGSVPGLPPWMTIHLALPLRTGSSCQPGFRAEAALQGYPVDPDHACAKSLFGIAPGGACRAGPVARPAVGFYPTVSPLPCKAWRSVFCGAFPWVTPAGRYPAPLPHGARTFLGYKHCYMYTRSSDHPHAGYIRVDRKWRKAAIGIYAPAKHAVSANLSPRALSSRDGLARKGTLH